MIFSIVARCSDEFPKKIQQSWRQDAQSRAQDGPRWQQDGHLGPNLGGLGPILASTCPVLGVPGRILGAFWTILADAGYIQKPKKNRSFCKVFDALGVVIWDGWGILAPCPYDVGRSWRQDGSKIDKNRPRWVQDRKKTLQTAILGPSWRQVGPNIFFQDASGGEVDGKSWIALFAEGSAGGGGVAWGG